jgi:hypothetical protein
MMQNELSDLEFFTNNNQKIHLQKSQCPCISGMKVLSRNIVEDRDVAGKACT